MLSIEVRDFKTEAGHLEDVATRASEQTLKDQELRLTSAIHEITQSMISMSHENDLVQFQEIETIDGNTKVVDIGLNGLTEKITKFDKLIELLKMTHLEQETLDFFLRYTLSSTDLLELKSASDPRYVEMDRSVEDLKHDMEEVHHRWIDETKLQISDATEELAKNQDIVNELYLETADILDECDQLVVEVEKLRKEKEQPNKQDLQNTPMAEDHEEWEKIIKFQNDLKHLELHLAELEAIKKDVELKETAKKLKQDPKLDKLGCTLHSLIRLWESNFLPESGWHDLEVYPQIRKFQFDVLEDFTVLVALDDRYSISDVTVYRKGEAGIMVDEKLQSELKQQNVGSRDVYRSMESITNHLKGLGM